MSCSLQIMRLRYCLDAEKSIIYYQLYGHYSYRIIQKFAYDSSIDTIYITTGKVRYIEGRSMSKI